MPAGGIVVVVAAATGASPLLLLLLVAVEGFTFSLFVVTPASAADAAVGTPLAAALSAIATE